MAPPRSAIVPEVVIFVFSAATGGEFALADSLACVFRRESRTIADFGKYVLVVHYLDAVSDCFSVTASGLGDSTGESAREKFCSDFHPHIDLLVIAKICESIKAPWLLQTRLPDPDFSGPLLMLGGEYQFPIKAQEALVSYVETFSKNRLQVLRPDTTSYL